MGSISIVRLTLVFATVLSLASFSGAMSSDFQLPTVQFSHANLAPSENWVPAGPAMDTLLAYVFQDQPSVFNDIQSATPNIDLTDSPLPPSLLSAFATSSNFFVTSPISEHGYFEVEFMLGSTNFWGCNMSFGNSQCGIDIRQGISHLIDKAKFAANQGTIFSAIDDPVPTSNGGLPSANPCSWDNGVVPPTLQPVLGTSMTESGGNCIVGAQGGTAFHLAPASGAVYPWQPSLSDLDMCAAAAHFIDAGLATGVVNPSPTPAGRNCSLTGLNSAVTTGGITFFVKINEGTGPAPSIQLGDSVAQAICALVVGTYTAGCGTDPNHTNIVHELYVPINGPTGVPKFPGLSTSTSIINQTWSVYTASFSNMFPFDKSLYSNYNSRFVSGISSNRLVNGGPCSNDSVPTVSASNYMYLCNANYDKLANQTEFAPCLAAPGDPAAGQAQPTYANCPSTTSLTAISAGYQTEDAFGKGAYTLPIFQESDQFGYLQCSPAFRPCSSTGPAEWQGVINHVGTGIPNHFTWLDAWNPNPTLPSTIRQGFSQTTRNPSPYIASTPWDTYIVHSVYDSLHVINPLNNAEDLNWMDTGALPRTTLTYNPPPGTVLTYDFQLMPNLNWQDGKPVTSFDVAFSYLSLLANGAFQSAGASSLSGITILGPTQFDLNLRSVGPFTRLSLTSLTILPGRYWTCGTGAQPSSGTAPNIVPASCPSTAASQWDSSAGTCESKGNTCYPVQYTLGTAPAASACYPNAAAPCSPRVQGALSGAGSFVPNLMNVDAVKTTATYDPIANHIFIGSGPWSCGTGAGLGQNCATGNIMNPGAGQSYTLQRNGTGVTPGTPGDYFRSSGFLAMWLWTGDITPGVNNYSTAFDCRLAPLIPLSSGASGCAHWQQGIGTFGATTPPGSLGCPGPPNTSPCGIPIGGNQLSTIKVFVNVNWVYPDDWSSLPPVGIVALDPILHQGSSGTLSPAALAGCLSPYPTGGYDC